MSNEIKVGQVVRVAGIRGPKMKVRKVLEDGENEDGTKRFRAYVLWFSLDNELQENGLDTRFLVRVDPEVVTVEEASP